MSNPNPNWTNKGTGYDGRLIPILIGQIKVRGMTVVSVGEHETLDLAKVEQVPP